MAFKTEHPDYKNYISTNDYHYHDVPTSAWSEFESLVDKACGPDRESLAKVVQMLATKVGYGNVANGNPYQWISDIVSKLRSKVNNGRFDLFMDCVSLLCEEGEIGTDEINEFMEENEFGYRAESGWNRDVSWEKIEDEDTEAVYDNTKNEIVRDSTMKNNRTKIFITHSSKDTAYVLNLTELLRNIKVPNSGIICTSDPRHKIPNGKNAYAWLREQFIDADLHMIFVLSENYYSSNPCLNEMGAAWLVAKKSDLLLLPGFGFGDLKEKDGCLDKDIQGGSIDSDDRQLKAWLNNLRDDVVNEFGIERPNDLDWEDYRDSFINQMRTVKEHKNRDTSEESADEDTDSPQSDNMIVQAIIDAGGEIKSINELAQITGLSMASLRRKVQQAVQNGDIEAVGAGKRKAYRIKKTTTTVSYTPTVGQDDVGNIPADSTLLLVYAASDNGQIIKMQTLGSPVQVSAAGKQFMADDSPRESARWVEALDRLISWGWVKPMGYKGELFELTGTGYQKADWLKEGMQINTDNEPLDELKEFGG